MVRSKNIINLLFKNVMQVGTSALGWYLVGYAFAYGNGDNHFIGTTFFGMHNVNKGLSDDADGVSGTFSQWFFSYTFCGTATTIASGCMAERTQLLGYLLFTFWTSMITYPLVVHWTWDPDGWLGAYNPDPIISTFGCLDFAGGLTVHVIGDFGFGWNTLLRSSVRALRQRWAETSGS